RRILFDRVKDDALAAERHAWLLVRILGRFAVNEIMRLVVAGRRVVEKIDLLQPLDRPVAGPAGDDQAQRRTVDVLQILTVHRPWQYRIGMQRLIWRQRLLVYHD